MQIKNIPWAGPRYWGNEERYVIDALRSSWISGGAYVERLEEDFARYCDASYAIAASNGTTALHMAYLALDILPGDEVIVPGFGFMAAANIALHVGAIPVFSEVDPDSWCMTAKDIERCITPKTKAIVPIHTYGNVCDMAPIMELADRKALLVLEDAAEAIGSKYMGRMAGTIAPVGIYSFHATKTITTGEGGAAVTSSIELRDRMHLFRSHGMAARRYWHEVAGHNFRLTNMQAAIGCAQLEQIEAITKERDRVYKTYTRLLQNVEGAMLQYYSDKVDPVVWAIAIALDVSAFSQGRDAVIEQLNQLGIETRPGFYSANTMPHIYGKLRLPVCEYLSQQVISLPSSPTLTEEEIERVCTSFKSCKK
ncbi:MAG: DegT/DnrJ/EryC1/StrS family aminotransferase [Dechloromonas sp.]|uniref:DegT/DnrJ/EryC1/StrS family aminotransferase n=1 Tax=Candidatus Dechloromonas phosphorivorans TaxID=2899244 RepID=A0A9D7QGY5_9RHOO|nr:DegT/DnrJ/EryC1/StrS family aminotransferase [Candidatus Dechloromonas phosphorivorans]